ncbi:hypothetical protein [Tepidiforma bonchosmolovskayae]|uniref:Copper resistance protein D domain-containing protein n=1 Tax=Tepidiforma bonchosmolovskayae TaxID=2601677 RepID=A0ABX6C3A0_9CHLR|nr:hypothetical protein [Tepidiforma bonchosmolovskayae]QFG02740.1 hypothetical protein Tbon_05360 [Tepidiforma bonchosmolovskayae]
MDTFLHMTFLWLHILGIALWVGPQVFLAVVWGPASRQIADLPTRVAAMRTITRRFGYLGGLGLALVIVAGTYLVFTWRDYYAIPSDAEFTSLRFGVWFIIKMNVLLVMLAVVALHTFWAGPKQLRLYEAKARGEAVDEGALRRARMVSMVLSVLGLLLTLAIMVIGVMIGTSGWSLQEV